MDDHSYEFLIVGSGAGGATLAKELALQGKEVLILERGGWEEKIGTFNDAVRFYDGNKITRIPKKSKEGVVLYHTFMAGGTTVVSCGNGIRSLEKQFQEHGIDLSNEFMEAEAELSISPVPDKLLTEGTQKMRWAAGELGHEMNNMPKFVDFVKCKDCGLCTLGCVDGAKWTALIPLKLALGKGAHIVYNTKVEKVIVKNGKAVGIECSRNRSQEKYYAQKIILAAGGMNTPVILQNSGFAEAGSHLFMDLLVNIYGKTDGLNQLNEPLMSLVLNEFHESQGFILSPFINSPRPIRLIEIGAAGVTFSPKKMIGLMNKTTDDRTGRVFPDGSVSKTPTAADRKRLEKGAELAKQILIKAGANPKSIVVSNIQGAHPGGSAAVGELVDHNLQTSAENLFVCDASVFPETPGLPPILTILALAKFLAKKLG